MSSYAIYSSANRRFILRFKLGKRRSIVFITNFIKDLLKQIDGLSNLSMIYKPIKLHLENIIERIINHLKAGSGFNLGCVQLERLYIYDSCGIINDGSDPTPSASLDHCQ